MRDFLGLGLEHGDLGGVGLGFEFRKPRVVGAAAAPVEIDGIEETRAGPEPGEGLAELDLVVAAVALQGDEGEPDILHVADGGDVGVLLAGDGFEFGIDAGDGAVGGVDEVEQFDGVDEFSDDLADAVFGDPLGAGIHLALPGLGGGDFGLDGAVEEGLIEFEIQAPVFVLVIGGAGIDRSGAVDFAFDPQFAEV